MNRQFFSAGKAVVSSSATAEAGSEPTLRCTRAGTPTAIDGLSFVWAQLRRTTREANNSNERSGETSSPRLSEGVRPQ